MNKISSLWRVGVLAAAVLGGSGGAYAATVLQEDFSAPINYGNCVTPNGADNPSDPNVPRALWRESKFGNVDTFGPFYSVLAATNTISGGQLAISSLYTGGRGIVTKLDSRFDFLSPGQKRKFVVKGLKIAHGGVDEDQTVKSFRFLIASNECFGTSVPHFEMTLLATGAFNVYVGKRSVRGDSEEHTIIDMDYSMPRTADQIELTLDNTNYELSFVFNVPDNGLDVTDRAHRPAYQGAFTYRGKHGMDTATWTDGRAGLVGYPASLGLFAAIGNVTSLPTNVTVDSITVTDGAP